MPQAASQCCCVGFAFYVGFMTAVKQNDDSLELKLWYQGMAVCEECVCEYTNKSIMFSSIVTVESETAPAFKNSLASHLLDQRCPALLTITTTGTVHWDGSGWDGTSRGRVYKDKTQLDPIMVLILA